MALSAYSATNIPLPDLHANKDYSSLGSLALTDTTGIVVDCTKFISFLLLAIPTAFTGVITIQGSMDNSTFFPIETIDTTTNSNPWWRVYQYGFLYYKITGTRSAGSTAFTGVRLPYLMAGTGNTVAVGP